MYIHMFIQLFKFWHWGSVHTEPEDFKNAVFTPKTHQFFLVYTTPKEFKKQYTLSGDFQIEFEENSVKDITWLHDVIDFETALC